MQRRVSQLISLLFGGWQFWPVRVSQDGYFTLAIDRQSQLWLSTANEIMRYDRQPWQRVGAPSLGLISAFETAPDSRLWFAGERGVAVYDPQHDTTP